MQRPTCRAPLRRSCGPQGGYRIEQAGSIEESAKATKAMLPLFPIMLALTLLKSSFCRCARFGHDYGLPDQSLDLIGVVPVFQQPFGINALVGLIALSGICATR